MARLLCFDVEAQSFHECECNTLDDFYRELKCDCLDVAVRSIGGEHFDIFVDDEGLLKDDCVVSVVGANGQPQLVGNLVFAHHDGAGETVSLSNEDISLIYSRLVIGVNAVTGEERKFVMVDTI